MVFKFPVDTENLNMTIEEFFVSPLFQDIAKKVDWPDVMVLEITGSPLKIESYRSTERFETLTFTLDGRSFRLYVPDFLKTPISKVVSFLEICQVAEQFLREKETRETFFVVLDKFLEEKSLFGLYGVPPGNPPLFYGDFYRQHGRDLLPQEPTTGFKMPLFRPTDKDDGKCVVLGNPFSQPFVNGGLRIKNIENDSAVFQSHIGYESRFRLAYLSLITREQAEKRMESQFFNNGVFAEAVRSLQAIEMYFKRPLPDNVAKNIIETASYTNSKFFIVPAGTIKNPGQEPILVGRLPNRKGLCVLANNGSKESMERFAGSIALTQKINPLKERIRSTAPSEKTRDEGR